MGGFASACYYTFYLWPTIRHPMACNLLHLYFHKSKKKFDPKIAGHLTRLRDHENGSLNLGTVLIYMKLNPKTHFSKIRHAHFREPSEDKPSKDWVPYGKRPWIKQ